MSKEREVYIKKRIYNKNGRLKKLVFSNHKVISLFKDGSVKDVYWRARERNPFTLSYVKGEFYL